MPADLASWATKLRTANFPPERNFLDAHVTLFHSLPPSAEGEIKTRLAAQAATYAPVNGYLDGVMPLGKGTALELYSPTMISIWEDLADNFFGLLTPQDAHAPQLHATIQNKVTIEEAQELQNELSAVVEPRPFRFAGLSLYIYRGGPWEFVRTYPFRGKQI